MQNIPKEEAFSKRHTIDKLKKVQESVEKMTKEYKSVRRTTPEAFASTYTKFQEFETKKKEKIDKIKEEQKKDKDAEFIGKPTLIAKMKLKNREPLVQRIDDILKNKEDKLKVKREVIQKQKEEMEAAISFKPKINESSCILKSARGEGIDDLHGSLIKSTMHHVCKNSHHPPEGSELFKPKINKFSHKLAVF